MNLSRSGYYNWIHTRSNPSQREKRRMLVSDLLLGLHKEHPSHGYRWLNAYIKLEYGIIFSDEFVRRCCCKLGIKSKAKHASNKSNKGERNVCPNLLINSLNIDRPMMVVVTDMTAFWANNKYWELTWFMDLFNDEIVGWCLSSKRGDPQTYYRGMGQVIQLKEKKYKDLELILHSDQGSVYSSRGFNEPLLAYNITHSMSAAGTPTDNAAMESINGWAKEELFLDFHLKNCPNVEEAIENYIYWFNNKRPMFRLNYMTPVQYRLNYESKIKE